MSDSVEEQQRRAGTVYDLETALLLGDDPESNIAVNSCLNLHNKIVT